MHDAGFLVADDGARLYLGDAAAQTLAAMQDRQRAPDMPDGPVLMLHSLFFDGTMFDAVRALLPPTLCVLTPDHRGQGRSEAGRKPPSIEQLADDAISLIERVVGRPVHIVGSSMGGYVALRIAEIRPDLIRTCVLSCCTAHAERQPERFAALEARIREAGTAEMGASLVQTMFGERFATANGAACRRWQRHFETLGASRSADDIANAVHGVFARRGCERLLPQLTMPLLLFSGELDRAKRPADMAFIAERVPGSRHVVLPDAGHTPPVECPDRFAREILQFWRRSVSDPPPGAVPARTNQELS